jgi:hypothetical protein
VSGEARDFEQRKPELSRGERINLSRNHYRVVNELREVWDEATSTTVEKFIPVLTPYCAACGEPWGERGCSMVRALALISWQEREAKEDARRISSLTDALSPRFATLSKMHREFAKWMRDVGDLARIRADVTQALTMDSERYTWLTTEFDPMAAAMKQPEAPWDDYTPATKPVRAADPGVSS